MEALPPNIPMIQLQIIPLFFLICAIICSYKYRISFLKVIIFTLIIAYISMFFSALVLLLVEMSLEAIGVGMGVTVPDTHAMSAAKTDTGQLGMGQIGAEENNIVQRVLEFQTKLILFSCINIAVCLVFMRILLKKFFNCERWVPTLIFGGLAGTIYYSILNGLIFLTVFFGFFSIFVFKPAYFWIQ